MTKDPTQSACCGGHGDAKVKPSSAAKYFCPMGDGVESDKPGDCPKCGMALERNPAPQDTVKTVWTCPMHPQVEQDHPGDCPICGMALAPKVSPSKGSEDGSFELHDMARRLWI